MEIFLFVENESDRLINTVSVYKAAVDFSNALIRGFPGTDDVNTRTIMSALIRIFYWMNGWINYLVNYLFHFASGYPSVWLRLFSASFSHLKIILWSTIWTNYIILFKALEWSLLQIYIFLNISLTRLLKNKKPSYSLNPHRYVNKFF